MSPGARVQHAYRLAAEGAAELQDGNDPASGERLLMRALSVNLTASMGPVGASEYILTLAREALDARRAS